MECAALPAFFQAAAPLSNAFQSPPKGLTTHSLSGLNPVSHSHTASTLPTMMPALALSFQM